MKNALLNELNNAFTIPKPAIGLDVDGTIDQAPEFFSVLSNSWPGDVHIITMRENMDVLLADLKRWNIRHDHIHLVQRFKDKSVLVAHHKLCMFFDDMPEVIKEIPTTYNVCLIRNDGNYDAENARFVMSDQTAYCI